jgi:hypothetical protein
MPKKTVQQMMLRRAKRRYDNMLTCLEVLTGTLPRVEAEIRKMNTRVKGRTFRIASQEDLFKLVANIRKKIVEFTETCKQYETKLTTKDWTV